MEGEKGEAVGDYFAGGASDWSGGGEGDVEIRTGGADEDKEDDELGDRGPSGGVDGISCDVGKWDTSGGERMYVLMYLSYA